MYWTKGFIGILIINLCLINCRKDAEIIIPTFDRYIIYLSNDNKFKKVENYINDSLNFYSLYNYKTDLVEIIKRYDKSKFYVKSIYFLNSGNKLADSCLDSTFSYNKLSDVTITSFQYDVNGYRIGSNIIRKAFNDNGSLSYTNEYKLSYEVINGNTKSIYNGNCSHYYEYKDIENKLDISTFHGDYNGTKNKNLINSNTSNCHPSSGTTTPIYNYEYTTNSNGFVIQRIEHNLPGYHSGDKQHTYKHITNFEYRF